jgi:hypothetical protein
MLVTITSPDQPSKVAGTVLPRAPLKHVVKTAGRCATDDSGDNMCLRSNHGLKTDLICLRTFVVCLPRWLHWSRGDPDSEYRDGVTRLSKTDLFARIATVNADAGKRWHSLREAMVLKMLLTFRSEASAKGFLELHHHNHNFDLDATRVLPTLLSSTHSPTFRRARRSSTQDFIGASRTSPYDGASSSRKTAPACATACVSEKKCRPAQQQVESSDREPDACQQATWKEIERQR